MRLIVFSDSHGNPKLLHRAEETWFSDPAVAGIVHLGDGVGDLSYICTGNIPVYSVCGNYEDCFSCSASLFQGTPLPSELILEAGGFKILIMHGHKFNVKSGYERAAAYAASKGADLLMFGHTHCQLSKYIPDGEAIGNVRLEKPLYIFNPGTAGKGWKLSYGVVDIRPFGIVTSFAE